MMVSSPMTPAEAPTIIAAQQAAWETTLREVGSQVAFMAALAQSLGGVDAVIRVFGPEVTTRANSLVTGFMEMYRVSRTLDRQQAALIAWNEADERGTPAGPTHIGVIDVTQLPPGGRLAGFPLVILAAGALIAALVWKRWDVDQTRLRQENRALEIAARARLQEQAATLQASDPQLWGQLQIAMQKASGASAQATADPRGFFDNLMAGIGTGAGIVAGAAMPPLLILGILWVLSQRNERRAA